MAIKTTVDELDVFHLKSSVSRCWFPMHLIVGYKKMCNLSLEVTLDVIIKKELESNLEEKWYVCTTHVVLTMICTTGNGSLLYDSIASTVP